MVVLDPDVMERPEVKVWFERGKYGYVGFCSGKRECWRRRQRNPAHVTSLINKATGGLS